ncbi:MAG: hypothetical protein QW420_04775 [Candidatus Caldarchaeum sp.]
MGRALRRFFYISTIALAALWAAVTMYPIRFSIAEEWYGEWDRGIVYVAANRQPVYVMAVYSVDFTGNGSLAFNWTVIDPRLYADVVTHMSGIIRFMEPYERVPMVADEAVLFQRGGEVALWLANIVEPFDTGLLLGRPAVSNSTHVYFAGPSKLCEGVFQGQQVQVLCRPYRGGRLFHLAANGSVLGLSVANGSAWLVKMVKQGEIWYTVPVYKLGAGMVPTSLSAGHGVVVASASAVESGKIWSTLLVESGGNVSVVKLPLDIRDAKVLPEGYVALAYTNSSGSYVEVFGTARGYRAVKQLDMRPYFIKPLVGDRLLVGGSSSNGAALQILRLEKPVKVFELLRDYYTVLAGALVVFAAVSASLFLRSRSNLAAVVLIPALLNISPPVQPQSQLSIVEDLDRELRELEAVLSAADSFMVATYLQRGLDKLRDEPLKLYLKLLSSRARDAILAGNPLEAEYTLYTVSKMLELSGADRRLLLDSVRRGAYVLALMPYVTDAEFAEYMNEVERRSAEVGRIVEEMRARGFEVRFEIRIVSGSPAILLLVVNIVYAGLVAYGVYSFIADAFIDRIIQYGYALAGIRLSHAEYVGMLAADTAVEAMEALSGVESATAILRRLNDEKIMQTWYRVMDGSPLKELEKFEQAGPVARRELADRIRVFCETLRPEIRSSICGLAGIASDAEHFVSEVLKRIMYVDKRRQQAAYDEFRETVIPELLEYMKSFAADIILKNIGLARVRTLMHDPVLSEMAYLVEELGSPLDYFKQKLYLMLFLRNFAAYLRGEVEQQPLVPAVFTVTALENKHGCRFGDTMTYLLPPVYLNGTEEVEVDAGVRVRYASLHGTYVVRVEDTMKCSSGHEDEPDYDDLILHIVPQGVNKYEVATAYAERVWEMTAAIGPFGRNLTLTNNDLLLQIHEPAKVFTYPELLGEVVR